MIKKVIRNNKVAVVISPEFGGGWSTWNDEKYQNILIFHPDIIENKKEITKDFIKNLVSTNKDIFIPNNNLEIKWIDKNTSFYIDVYNGSESIKTS